MSFRSMSRRGLLLVFPLTASFNGLMAQKSPITESLPAGVTQPPTAATKEHLSDWHGEKVNDPYFWLREKANPEVIKYLEAENAYTEAHTREVKTFGESLYKEMLGRIKQTDLSVPYRLGKWFYYSRTEEGKQYGIQCRRAASAEGKYDEKAPEQVLLDLNALAEGHSYLGLGAFAISEDGNQLLYSTDVTGFRQYTLYLKDLKTGATTAPLAERVTGVAWATDNQTVFYTTEDAVTKRSDKLWRMNLKQGTPELQFEEKDELFRIGVGRTKDKAYIVCGSYATDTYEQRVLSANQPLGSFKVVLAREKGHKYSVDHREGLFYIRTNKHAKNFRMVTAPDSDPSESHWKPFLAHDPKVLLEDVELFKSHAVAIEKSEGLDRMRVLDFKSGKWHTLTFPESVYTAGPAANPEYDTRVFRLNYQSMVTPSSVFDCDLASGKRTLMKQQEVLGGYDPSQYATERAWATARDGVKVPLSIVYKKGFQKNGQGACFLYAYGSYGFGMSPTFSTARLSLLDRGMVFVIAHIRGGNEMGEAWHDDGMLMKKKNTFFDFIDSAEWLVANQWTSKERLVIEGGSAGGLLMGAVANYRPDLFKAVHAAVPFVDVMNTMLDTSLPLTVGEYLEWGNPNDKAAFAYMRSYSPYDNIERKAYPAMLVTTSLNDSQVMYWEPTKYVAKLRAMKTDSNPLYLKCNMGAGHGGASGRYDRLKEVAFEYAWLMSQVGIQR
jgi:oligopeptidase B